MSSNPPSERKWDLDGWPAFQQQMASVPHVHAMGQISLQYNLLEAMFGTLFERTAPLKREAAQKLFHRSNNRDRIDLMKDFVQHRETEQDALEALIFSLNCFNICTENRNILLHVLADFAEENDDMVFSKAPRSNPFERIEFNLSVKELRLVAEQMADCFNYMWAIDKYLFYRDSPSEFRKMLRPRALPVKPAKPNTLSPLPVQVRQPP